jgi:hypothetical protein
MPILAHNKTSRQRFHIWHWDFGVAQQIKSYWFGKGGMGIEAMVASC